MLKLGVIDVLNVLPVYYGILKGIVPISCEIVKGKVTELNKKLNSGEIDISVISSFEYATNYTEYFVLPKLSVSADGPVKSIYLFTQRPLNEMNGDRIKLTELSFTSVHLVQYLLKELNVAYVKDDTDVSGELLIADDAIRRYYEKCDPYVYDLSALWKEKTKLPFVFALWCVRKEVFLNQAKSVREVHAALLKSRELSRGQERTMANEKFKGVFPDPHSCTQYLENLRYDFSPQFQAGFNLFQEKMIGLGKLMEKAPIRLIQ